MIKATAIALMTLLALAVPGGARAGEAVQLKDVHLCCGACVKGVAATLEALDGAEATCDREKRTISLEAADDSTLQKAVNLLAAAGYHGKPNREEIDLPDDSGAPEGKVKSLALTGFHNCCRGCASALAGTAETVEGVSEAEVEPKGDTLELSGDFDAQAVVKALNEAGFHVKVKKES